jgi:hypothetical protein
VRQGQGLLSRGIPLGQGQLYSGTSRIEGVYYRMFQFHNVYAWKGAYHFSADFAHWSGWGHLQLSLIEIEKDGMKPYAILIVFRSLSLREG